MSSSKPSGSIGQHGLGAAVAAWCKSIGVAHLSLALFDRTGMQTCSFGAAAGRDRATPVTCLAKPLTMLLVQRAVKEGRLDLDEAVAPELPLRLRHLISHTHGLDGDDLPRAMRLSDGRIDAQRMLAGIEARPLLHPSGAAHSYSDFGYWIAGAVLERAYNRTSGALLVNFLADNLGAGSRARIASGAADYCPAQGGGLTLTALDLASILRFYLASNGVSTALDSLALAKSVSPFPGWTVTDNGFSLGWRSHGAGWFGHSGRESLDQIVIARFNPTAGVGMAIISTDGRAFLLAEHIGRMMAPEQGAVERTPAPAPATPPSRAADYCGAFVNGAVRLDVSLNDHGFCLTRSAEGVSGRWPLRWAQHQTAFVTRPGLGAPYYIQYLDGVGGPGSQHLWTGSRLWRRTPTS